MAIKTSSAARNIQQSTPEPERTLSVGVDSQEQYKLLVCVERNGVATGVVDLYAKLLTAEGWSKLGSVDLGQLTEINITQTGGPIVSVMASPIGVVGSFDFSFVGF